jgi:hypothetical protein
MPSRQRSYRPGPATTHLPMTPICYKPKIARIRPRRTLSSWTPVSVSSRFPVASSNTKVVLPTSWRLANARPSGVLRSARTNATCPRNSGRSASTTRLSWAQFGQPGKKTCTNASFTALMLRRGLLPRRFPTLPHLCFSSLGGSVSRRCIDTNPVQSLYPGNGTLASHYNISHKLPLSLDNRARLMLLDGLRHVVRHC